jgi:hypothetical protein
MQVQHDEALAQREAAHAQRDEAIAERDEARRQRDEVLLAHRALRQQLQGEWASSERAQPQPTAPVPVWAQVPDGPPPRAQAPDGPPPPAQAPDEPPRPAQAPDEPPTAVLQPPTERARAASEQRSEAASERPSGVRVIPATRTVGAHLHRAQRERDHGVTQLDMWAVRILGGVAAIAFISLLVMILKAFFVF